MFFIDLNNLYDLRYSLEKFVEMKYGVYDVLDSYFMENLLDMQADGQFDVKEEARRPDLISYYIYNTDVQYWWIIMNFNRMLDYNNIRRNSVLEYVSIDHLEDVYFVLNAKKNAFENSKKNLFAKQTKIYAKELEAPPSKFVTKTLDLGYLKATEEEALGLPSNVDLGRL